jgi:hypothetical protein
MGYDVKDRKLVVNDAEAKTVRMIFERFAALGSASTLARALQAENVRNCPSSDNLRQLSA